MTRVAIRQAVWHLTGDGADRTCANWRRLSLYKIAHSWLDPVLNPVQTALGCPLRTEALAYPINGG